MRVLYICGGDLAYIRNQMLRRALGRSFDLVEVAGTPPGYARMHLAAAGRYLRVPRRSVDLIVVGFMGHLLVPWVRLWTSAPILFDPYVSIWDTLCLDRGRFGPRSVMGRLAYAVDAWSCRLADGLLADTGAHREFFVRSFGVPVGKMEVLYVGCDEEQFVTSPVPPPALPFEVFTYASFLRLHGVEQIVRAAKHLQGLPEAVFTIAGSGPRLGEMQRLARDMGLENVRFPGWIPFDELPRRIAQSAVCLGGHFSAVDKAARVIATKTFQFLSVGRPVIAGDNSANRELLTHMENAVLCPMADSEALADSIRLLHDDAQLRETIGRNGARLFRERLGMSSQAERLRQIACRLVT